MRRALSTKASLPIINVSALVDPSASLSAKIQVGKQLDAACRTAGFFYMTGHGHSEQYLKSIRSSARRFFLDQSDAQKEAISLTNHETPIRGYQKVLENITQGKPDYHEAIDLYADDKQALDLIGDKKHPLNVQNQYPDYPQGFKSEIEKYVEEMNALGAKVMGGFALGMDLPENYFDKFFNHPFWVMRIIGYPSSASSKSSDDELGCGEHTDYGCLTLVNPDPIEHTLQVRNKDTNEWMNADPIPGAFVVNIGDMLAYWTNGVYRSTPHRVLRPQSSQGYRVSVPFFFEPNYNAEISPLPQFIKEKGVNTEKNVKVIYGDHLMQRVLSNFKYSPNLEQNLERKLSV
jgi:isopenicillin N synthase-like dioxygenase